MGTVDAQCPVSDWRYTPLATNPTPNDEFQYTSVTYYTSTVLKAIWPAFVGLGSYAILLLAFIFWRLILTCTACIHRRKLFKTPSIDNQIGNTPRKKVLVIFGKPAWIVRGALLAAFFGIAVGCIYGMVGVNSEIVDSGLGTVAGVENYIDTVLGGLDDGIQAGNTIDSALVDIQTLLDTNINATDLSTQLNCLRPWLQDLPLPQDLRTQVESAAAYIGSLGPLLNIVAGNLSILAVESTPGTWTGSLPTIIQSETSLGHIAAQATAFSTASSAVTIPEPPGAMTAARNALNALLNSPPYSDKLATIDATILALQETETAMINADDAMNITLLYAISLIGGPATDLNATLGDLTESYVDARPCMIRLRARTQLINETVMLLPNNLNQDMIMLNDTQFKMDGVLNVEAEGEQTTAQQLSQALVQANQQIGDAQDLGTQVSDVRQLLTGNAQFDTLVTSLQSVRNTMAAAQNSLTNLLTSMNAYLATPNPIQYAMLVPQVQGAGIAAGTAGAALNSWITSAQPVYNQSQQVIDELSSTNVTASIYQLNIQLAALPAGPALLAPVDEYAAQYATLPQPSTLLIDEATVQLISIVTNVSAAVIDSRSVLGDAIAGAEMASLTFRENTIGTIEETTAQYEPQVRYYDAIRQAALYSLFAVALVLDVVLLIATLLLWPAALKFATFLLLVLFTISFALVVGLTAGLKVGTDGCANLESQVLEHVSDPSVTTIARYYFYGENNTSPKDILLDVFNVDVDAALAQVVAARENLQQGMERYSVRGAMAAATNEAVKNSFGVVTSVTRVMDLIDYNSVNNVYVNVKQYPCCTILDMAGSVWTGIIVAGVFVFAQCILSMILIGIFDKMNIPGHNCCKWYGSRAGKEKLQSLDTSFPDTSALEAGTVAAENGASATTKAPRQSKIFRILGNDNNRNSNTPVSIVADSRTAGEDGSRRRSSAPPPASAPPPPSRFSGRRGS